MISHYYNVFQDKVDRQTELFNSSYECQPILQTLIAGVLGIYSVLRFWEHKPLLIWFIISTISFLITSQIRTTPKRKEYLIWWSIFLPFALIFFSVYASFKLLSKIPDIFVWVFGVLHAFHGWLGGLSNRPAKLAPTSPAVLPSQGPFRDQASCQACNRPLESEYVGTELSGEKTLTTSGSGLD